MICLFLLFLLTPGAIPQQQPQEPAKPPTVTPPPKAAPPLPAWVDELVKKQFGPEFSVVADFYPAVVTADLDGDQVEDCVIVGRSKNPLLDQQNHGYKVVDPHTAYFGFGDVKVTWEFNMRDPERNRFLLVIHGAGADTWRAATPKAKFVLVNIPFDRLGLTRIPYKKKTINALSTEETTILTSVVFWNGKKYRWEPNRVPGE
ncbi:MAG: hypothetical protein ACRD3I_05715 [Terriglobales bacterium]